MLLARASWALVATPARLVRLCTAAEPAAAAAVGRVVHQPFLDRGSLVGGTARPTVAVAAWVVVRTDITIRRGARFLWAVYRQDVAWKSFAPTFKNTATS